MWDKIRKAIQHLCDILETLVAIGVGISLIICVVLYLPSGVMAMAHGSSTEAFLHFLGQVFNLVVGIEFMKLLCKPSTDNVIEIVIFLVARHMIMSTEEPSDIFLSVLAIAILCVVRKFSRVVNEKWPHKSERVVKAEDEKMAQTEQK